MPVLSLRDTLCVERRRNTGNTHYQSLHVLGETDLGGAHQGGLSGGGVISGTVSYTHTHTHAYIHTGDSGPSRGMSRVQSPGPQAWLQKEAAPGGGDVPLTLTASVPHLGVFLIPFNEPHVSPEQEAPWLRPPFCIPACFCFCLSLCLFLPSSILLWLPTQPYSPLFPPTLPLGARGLGNRAAHTSRSHCSTICFCLHLVGRRQERTKRLMRHCAAGLPRERQVAGGRASHGDRELIRSSLTGGKSEISSSPTVNN